MYLENTKESIENFYRKNGSKEVDYKINIQISNLHTYKQKSVYIGRENRLCESQVK